MTVLNFFLNSSFSDCNMASWMNLDVPVAVIVFDVGNNREIVEAEMEIEISISIQKPLFIKIVNIQFICLTNMMDMISMLTNS